MSLKITYTTACGECLTEFHGVTIDEAAEKARACDHKNPPKPQIAQKLVDGVWQDA